MGKNNIFVSRSLVIFEAIFSKIMWPNASPKVIVECMCMENKNKIKILNNIY